MMRIAQTTDGRFIKVLSPELQGMIGRLYEEIRDRKGQNSIHDTAIASLNNTQNLMKTQLDNMSIRYAQITDILDQLFPEDESAAYIDRPLNVKGAVQALQFTSTVTDRPPMVVASTMQVDNFNAALLNGVSHADITAEINTQINTLNADITNRMAQYEALDVSQFTPISHVGSGGTQHAVATETAAGFMSAEDKTKLDKFTISMTAPAAPVTGAIWIDLN